MIGLLSALWRRKHLTRLDFGGAFAGSTLTFLIAFQLSGLGLQNWETPFIPEPYVDLTMALAGVGFLLLALWKRLFVAASGWLLDEGDQTSVARVTLAANGVCLLALALVQLAQK